MPKAPPSCMLWLQRAKLSATLLALPGLPRSCRRGGRESGGWSRRFLEVMLEEGMHSNCGGRAGEDPAPRGALREQRRRLGVAPEKIGGGWGGTDGRRRRPAAHGGGSGVHVREEESPCSCLDVCFSLFNTS